MTSSSGDSRSTSTSKRDRRSSTPASAIGSLTRTRVTRSTCLERSQGVRDADAGLDLRAEVGQPQLDGGQRRRHVEDVVVADVADAKHRLPSGPWPLASWTP